MECPHCNKEIPGDECSNCGVIVPFKSHYCTDCGAHLKEETDDMIDQESEFDLENRVLCPDGTCTGIIIDGKCSECRKPHKEKRA